MFFETLAAALRRGVDLLATVTLARREIEKKLTRSRQFKAQADLLAKIALARCLLLWIDCIQARGRHGRRDGESDMRIIFGAVCFVIAATPALAACPTPGSCAGPAPLLGLGIPAVIAVGGALFGARFFKKK